MTSQNKWCLLVFVCLLVYPAVSSYRLGSGGGASWGASGAGNGGLSVSGSSSLHLGLGGFFKGILNALEGKGDGSGNSSAGAGGSGGHGLGGSFSFMGGLGDSSLSFHGSLSLRSFLTSIFSLPFRLPKIIFKFVVGLVWNIVTLNISILRFPLSLVGKIVNFVLGIVKSVIRTILNVIVNVNSLNIDIIVGVIDKIKSLVAWIIRTVSSAQIFGIKIGVNVVSFFKNGIENVIKGVLDLVIWVLVHVSELLEGAFQVLHVKDILRLPGISTVVGVFKWVRNFAFTVIFENVQSVARFVDSIIYQHQDFFIPIFRSVTNFILALVRAYQQIEGGAITTGIEVTLGDLYIAIGPLASGFWKIHGLGGETFGNFSGEGCPPPSAWGPDGGNVVLGGNEGAPLGGTPFGGLGAGGSSYGGGSFSLGGNSAASASGEFDGDSYASADGSSSSGPAAASANAGGGSSGSSVGGNTGSFDSITGLGYLGGASGQGRPGFGGSLGISGGISVNGGQPKTFQKQIVL